MTTSTTTYTVSLGDTIENGGQDYGTLTAESPEDAVRAVLRDLDRSREYDEIEQVSHSPTFGHGSEGRSEGNAGNGAQDRSAWWYVERDGRFVGIYVAHEVRP